jgi:hypothetical protein
MIPEHALASMGPQRRARSREFLDDADVALKCYDKTWCIHILPA